MKHTQYTIKQTGKLAALALSLLLILAPLTSVAETAETEENRVAVPVVFTIGSPAYTIDGETIQSDVAPYIQDGRTMLPVSHVSRALGAQVEWDAITRTVSITKDTDTITMIIGSRQLMKNGLLFMEMDTVPEIRDIGDGLGRTMLPVSRLARALEVDYLWNETDRTVTFYLTGTDPDEELDAIVY